MARRFYLGYQGSYVPGVGVPYHSEWETVNNVNSAYLRQVKRAQTLTTLSVTRTIAGVMDGLIWQGITDPLDVDQTISGTFVGVARFNESNTGADMRVQCVVRVVAPNGTTRGVLIAPDTGGLANEFASSTSRIFPRGGPTAVTPVAALAGDRIVVEVGYRTHHGGSNGYNGQMVVGDSSATDLGLAEGDATNNNPWVEFSQDITFAPVGILGVESLDIITQMSGPGRMGFIGVDVLTKMSGPGRLGFMSMDVLLPNGMPNGPQIRWGADLSFAPPQSLDEALATMAGPRFRFKMDEVSGNLVDATGNGNHGVVSGAPTYQRPSLLDDGTGKSILFGTSQYADVADAAWMDNIGQLTIFGTIKTTGTGVYKMIVTRDDAGASGLRNYQFRVNTDGRLSFVRVTPTTVEVLSATGKVVNDGVAHDIAVVLDSVNTTATLYIDGLAVGSSALFTGGPMSSGTLQTMIGARKNGGALGVDSNVGQLDEVMLWDVALGPADIARLHRGRIAVGYSSLEPYLASLNPTHWFKLGDAAGATFVQDYGSGALADARLSGTYTMEQMSLDASNPAAKSILFNGGGVRTDAAVALGVPGVDDVTMVALVRPISVSGTLKSIAGIEGASTFEGNAFQLRWDNTALVALVGGTGGAGYAAWSQSSPVPMQQDVTMMVALKRTPTTAQQFVNGFPQGGTNAVSNDLAANDRFGIGIRGSDGGRAGQAYIQHVLVFKNIDITSEQIHAMAVLAGLAT